MNMRCRFSRTRIQQRRLSWPTEYDIRPTSPGSRLEWLLRWTNLTLVLTRRHVIDRIDHRASPGRSGGWPALIYKFVARELTVTDTLAVLRPPR